jgi:hypothetical protein
MISAARLRSMLTFSFTPNLTLLSSMGTD